MYQREQQIFFGEELQQINQVYIKTSYGNIFAHAVGQHGQPLIIVVHGSGPRNSGDEYLYLLHEYLVRVSYIEKFFIIAIDCPGYGRSKGSKQAIKTFPLQMFKQILKDLGYNSYFAMLGHSQGGAAIFNAVYEDPKLTQFLLMDRPVCGNIKRFAKFPLPTLLLYDIEDDGHPIWQGKLLYKQLLSSQFYTYRHSQNPFWVPDNIWNLTLSFFRKYSTSRKTLMGSNFSRNLLVHRSLSVKQKNKSQSKSKPKRNHVSTSKYEEVKKQRGQQQKKLVQISQIDKSEIYSRAADLEELQNLPTWLNQPKVQQTEEDIKKEEQQKRERMKKYEKQIKIQELAEEPIKKEKKKIEVKEKEKKQQKKQQKEQKIQKKLPKQKEQKVQKEQKISDEKKESLAQDKCSICHENYYAPIQTNCKHIFCKKCIGQSLLVDLRCPLCRTAVTKRTQNPGLHEKICEKMDQKQRQRRQKDLYQFQQMLKSIVKIQMGNTSRQLQTKKSAFATTKKKYKWQLFVKEPKNFKFEQVLFDINMGDPSSVPVRVTHAPFVFQSRGTFSFSCQITIKPKNKDYAPLTVVHRIDVIPGTHSKVVAIKKKKN